MTIIDMLLGTPLGVLFRLCFEITADFGWAIILFTFLTKIILFPISFISQKNAVIMVRMKPQLDDIQERYAGEYEVMIKEQKVLYKKEHYSTFKATLPLLIQIPIILGVISVMYSPLKHVLNIDPVIIDELSEITMSELGVENLDSGAQLQIINMVQASPETFSLIDPEVIYKIRDFDVEFCGINLSSIPDFSSLLLLIPVLSALSAFLLSAVQNILNPLTREQGFMGKWGVAIVLTVFSGYFAAVCPAGVGLYWIAGNVFGILVTVVCNAVYNPKKYIDYENRSIKPKLTKEEKRAKAERKRLEKDREKEDMKRFFGVKKEVVFYSDASGFYKYFEQLIDYILEHSDITVHYLTSDLNDQVFRIKRERFETYFCSDKGLITTFMKMDCEIHIMTMPDLEQYHIKRSLVKKDIEYIYLDHGLTSFHLALRKGALDYFDTIFCYSKNHNEEIRAMERIYGTPEKKLVNVGFSLYDMLMEQYRNMPKTDKQKKQVLIAPSWQKDNILEICLPELLEPLLCGKYRVILRPHPEFVKRFPGKMKSIFDKYGNRLGEDFEIQTDFSSNATVYSSDLVITDWSSIAQEFSFTTKKPSLFINTPMKVMNLEWREIGIEPMEIWIREKIGKAVNVDMLGTVENIVAELIDNTAHYSDVIADLMNEYMYNVGHAAEAGGEYIISQISRKRYENRDEE